MKNLICITITAIFSFSFITEANNLVVETVNGETRITEWRTGGPGNRARIVIDRNDFKEDNSGSSTANPTKINTNKVNDDYKYQDRSNGASKTLPPYQQDYKSLPPYHNGAPSANSANNPVNKKSQEEYEKEYRMKKDSCSSFFSAHFSSSSWFKDHKFCDSSQVLEYFDVNQLVSQEKLDRYKGCIKANSFLDAINTSFITDCSRESVQDKILSADYPMCYKNLKALNINESGYNSIFNTCSTSYDFHIIASENFKICTEKVAPFENKSDKIFQICTSRSSLDLIVKKEFDSCSSRLKDGGVYNELLLSLCTDEDVLKTTADKNFNTCMNNLKNAGLVRSLDQTLFCANEKSNKGANLNPNCYARSHKTLHKFYAYYSFLLKYKNRDRTYVDFLIKDCEVKETATVIAGTENYGKNKAGAVTPPVAAPIAEPQPKTENKFLKLIKEINLHSNETFYDSKNGPLVVGGLSALSYDAKTSTLSVLSDDNSNNYMGSDKPPRIYNYRLNNDFTLSEQKITYLQKLIEKKIEPPVAKLNDSKNGKDPVKSEKNSQPQIVKVADKDLQIDPEGLFRLSNGHFIISSEVSESKYNRSNEKYYNLNIFSPIGDWVGSIELPKSFETKESDVISHYYTQDPKNPKKNKKVETVTKKITHGLYFNKSLEALTLSPDESLLFTANEGPLIQDLKSIKPCIGESTFTNGSSSSGRNSDNNNGKANEASNNSNGNSESGSFYSYNSGGKPTSNKCGGSVRIAKYSKESDFIITDKSVTPPVYKPLDEYKYDLENEKENGLVELLAIDATKLLVLERGWDSQKQMASGKLFLVELSSDSIIPENMSLDQSENIPPVKKTLLVDLALLSKELAPGFRVLDNFEGLGWGPTLSNGNPTLILVSDNNFSNKQRSAFLIFEVKKELQDLGLVNETAK